MMNRFFHPLCCHFMQEDGSFSIMPEIATDMLAVGSSTCGYRVLGSLNVRLCLWGATLARSLARDLCGGEGNNLATAFLIAAAMAEIH